MEGHERYDEGLRELAQRKCHEEERTIQQMVFRYKVMKRSKGMESGNQATKIKRRMMKHRGCVLCPRASCMRCCAELALPLHRAAASSLPA